MKQLAVLNHYFWKYRNRFLLGILFVGLGTWFQVLQPKLIGAALDAVYAKVEEYRSLGGIQNHPEVLDEMMWFSAKQGLIIILVALTMGVFMYFKRQTIIVMSRLIEYDLRKEIFAHYERLDLAFYKRNSTGDMMSRISEDVNKVRMYLGPAILYGLDLVFLFAFAIVSMLRVSPVLTFWSLLPLPFLSLSIYWVSSLINKKSEKIQAQLAALTSTTQEVYSGVRVVKSYVQEAAMGRWFAGQAEDYRKKSLEMIQVDAFFFPLMMLLIGASTILTVYVGGLQVVAGNLTAGKIAEFVIYINMLTWPVTAIGWIASIIQQAAASQKRINEFMLTQPTIVNPVVATNVVEVSNIDNVHKSQALHGEIIFENVNFKYPDTGIEALRNVSFKIKPGEKWAIVGRTGCGKTTVADLLVRMYDVSGGRVLVDGLDLRKHDLSNLRRRIGYVPQDVFLFSDSVFGNIAFGKDNLTRPEAEKFAASAAIHDEILGLPQGYETVVGERGVTLSGGQKQRISIARAFAKQPDIVLLDDCLSAVDTNTEAKITQYLTEALAEKTSIIITHRIYGSLNFDKILVLENGTVAEIGTHEELLSSGGYYFEMYQKQLIGEEI